MLLKVLGLIVIGVAVYLCRKFCLGQREAATSNVCSACNKEMKQKLMSYYREVENDNLVYYTCNNICLEFSIFELNRDYKRHTKLKNTMMDFGYDYDQSEMFESAVDDIIKDVRLKGPFDSMVDKLNALYDLFVLKGEEGALNQANGMYLLEKKDPLYFKELMDAFNERKKQMLG